MNYPVLTSKWLRGKGSVVSGEKKTVVSGEKKSMDSEKKSMVFRKK